MGAIPAFLRDVSFYKRDISPLEHYVEQSAFFIFLMTGKPIELCREFVKEQLTQRRRSAAKIRNPEVVHLTRGDNGDRVVERTPLSKYLANIRTEGYILAPTGTAYLPKSVRKSLISNFMGANVKIRSTAKKEAQVAEAAGLYELYVLKENEQKNRKTYNNAMSGTFGAKGTALHNPTAHSTLTSTTRNVSAVGNSSNEKLIAGNRHYRDYQTTLNNIVAIAEAVDTELVTTVMSKYGLHYPTADETMSMIRYSSDLYWHDPRAWDKLKRVLARMSPVQLAGVVYISDLYHLRKHNPDFVRELLWSLAKPVQNTSIARDDCYRILKETDEQIVNFLHQANISLVRGIGKDYKLMDDAPLSILAASCVHVTQVVARYRDLFEAFFLTKVMPASTSYLPDMMRRVVVLSDTDSTMFSCDEFVEWEFGSIIFNDDSFAFAGAVAYIATQCIGHNLALLAGNIGVSEEDMFRLAMKPEYVFPTHAQTAVAKHYWATMMVKEGNVYDKPKYEIKGVHLKSSAVPKAIVSDAQALMKSISDTIENNGKVSMLQLLKHVADIERSIIQSVRNSESIYLRRSKIKSAEGYAKGPTESPYRNHTYWNTVWGHDYRMAPEPTYEVLKLPTILKNRTAFETWIAGIENPALKQRLINDMETHNRKAQNTFYLPMSLVKSYGIPKEIQAVVNIRKIILDITKIHRMVIDTLGYGIKHDIMVHELGY